MKVKFIVLKFTKCEYNELILWKRNEYFQIKYTLFVYCLVDVINTKVFVPFLCRYIYIFLYHTYI